MAEKTIKCPKCGQENTLPSEECEKCGSSFALFAETRSVIEELKQENEEIEELLPLEEDEEGSSVVCPKCGHENPYLSEECAKCGIVFSKYYEVLARKQEDEKERERALRKKEEAEQRAEALRKQREEEEKAEALKRQKEAEERAEALRKQKEEEEKAEAIRRQKEEEEEERAEALRKQKEEEEKAEALREQKEEEEKAEAIRRRKEEEEKAEAMRRQKEEEAIEEIQKTGKDIIEALKPKPKIKALLKKYEGQTIGINYEKPADIIGASLARVNDDHFSIFVSDDRLMVSFPYTSILSIIEGVNGVSIGSKEDDTAFSVVIKVHHPN
jgi:ribosomal protein L40E